MTDEKHYPTPRAAAEALLDADALARRPAAVAFEGDDLVVTLADGTRIATPLDLYPRLREASPEARADFRLMPMGVHWPAIDEDLSVAGMLEGRSAAPRR